MGTYVKCKIVKCVFEGPILSCVCTQEVFVQLQNSVEMQNRCGRHRKYIMTLSLLALQLTCVHGEPLKACCEQLKMLAVSLVGVVQKRSERCVRFSRMGGWREGH